MEIYHVLNRGVDKRKIFSDQQDYFRFVHDLYEFNDQAIANTTFHTFKQNNDIGCREIKKKRKLLVNLLAFALMPNHYHLVLSPRVQSGLPRFMQKLNIGYAKYFNRKYDRSGVLFQGSYKSVQIKNESHLIHILYYVHLNPLDLIEPGWRTCSVTNYRRVIDFLGNYRWSSFLDYIGKNNFPSVTSRNFFSKFFGGNYKTETISWIKDMDLTELSDKSLE